MDSFPHMADHISGVMPSESGWSTSTLAQCHSSLGRHGEATWGHPRGGWQWCHVQHKWHRWVESNPQGYVGSHRSPANRWVDWHGTADLSVMIVSMVVYLVFETISHNIKVAKRCSSVQVYWNLFMISCHNALAYPSRLKHRETPRSQPMGRYQS